MEASRVTSAGSPPTNLNSLLSDIYKRYIALKPEEFKLHYKVFTDIFNHLHETMKQVDPYYGRYSSKVEISGSHYDGLRITKPDEFDITIGVRLPLNPRYNPLNPAESDIVIETNNTEFLQLRMGTQYQNLPQRDGADWLINKTAYQWKDEKNYLLQSKFMSWFQSVVDKALNTFTKINYTPILDVDGVRYKIKKSIRFGPAVTLHIESGNFKMDVDVVLGLILPNERWPKSSGFTAIPSRCSKNDWMVVPRLNKGGQNEHDKSRSWRCSLKLQEREIMYNLNNLKQAVRLLKKLRDTQNMTKINSYCIKTLFLWEIESRNDLRFWSDCSPGELFISAVKKLHKSMIEGHIPFFWLKKQNLIGEVNRSTLNEYAAKLSKLVDVLNQPAKYKMVSKFLLTNNEFIEYNMNILHL